MKKLLVLILFSISACKHQTPVEKVTPLIVKYLDSIGKHDSILNVHQFKQRGEFTFTCEFIIKEGGTGFPQYATGFFEFDPYLIKVKKFDFDTH